MKIFPKGSQSVLSRVVAAEVRARLAAERMSQRDFARALNFSSLNYLAIRLRDEKPFSLDDLQRIVDFWEEDADEFLSKAYESHSERLWNDLYLANYDEPTAASSQESAAVGRVGVKEEDGVVTVSNETDQALAVEAELAMRRRKKAKVEADARDMSSFDDSDAAARSEDTEKPRLD